MVCGGDYYDRDVYAVPSSSSSSSYSSGSSGYSAPRQYSDRSDKILSSNDSVHKSWNPMRFKEVEDRLVDEHENPIVIILDVTGSMGDWPKIIYDKLPMFYGQLMMKKYLRDPSLGFCCISDAYFKPHLFAPLQISDFGQGKQIDQILSKMHISGGGGGNGFETYELGGYFYNRKLDMPNVKMPFMFICGDDTFHPTIEPDKVMLTMGLKHDEGVTNTQVIWDSLQKKFNNNVFFLDAAGHQQCWKNSFGGSNVIPVKTAKAVVDIMLGVIALKNGKRSLSEYIDDLKEKGQTLERQNECKNALQELSKSCKKNDDPDEDFDLFE